MRRYARYSLPASGLVTLVFLVAACSAALAFTSPEPERAIAAPPEPTPTCTPDSREIWPYATPTPVASRRRMPGPGVADLLATPPAGGEIVEVDAYYSGADLVPIRGPRPSADQVLCPHSWEAALTDRPFQGLLSLLNGVHSNVLPDDAPWLIAVAPEGIWPGVRAIPDLPYHARLRGYMGDPAFAGCARPARYFVVMETVEVYEEEPPAAVPAPAEDTASWPVHHEPAGYSLPYPPLWQVESLNSATLVLRAPQWPDWPILVRLHAGETDPDDPVRARLLAGDSWGVYEQSTPGSQGLKGYQVDRYTRPDERAVSVLFSAHGYTYELALRYPLGFDAPQPLLTAYTAMVEGFHLDRP